MAGNSSFDELNRRKFLALGAGAGAAVALAGCGDDATVGGVTGGGGKEYKGPAVTLNFWNGFTGGDGPFMRKLVEQFSQEQKNIDVKMNVYQWQDYYQKMPAAIASGKGPDVGIMHIDQLSTNAARNVIIPLDDVAKALELKEEDFAPVVWKAGTYKDKRYGIPLDMHPLGFYYNKALMQKAGLDPEKPPQTKDEYMAALDAMKGKGIQGMWMTPHPFTGSMQFQSLLWQFGGDLFNEDATKAAFNSDAGVSALTWMVDIVKNGHSPKNVGPDADVVAFQNSKNAFNWNGIWQIGNHTNAKNLQWGVAPLPQIGTEKAAWAGSHNFVIIRQRTPDNNKLEAARVFINWVSQKSLEWAKAGQVPARKSVRESEEFKALTGQAALAQQVDYLNFAPPKPGIADAFVTMETAINEAVLLRKEPKAALDAAAVRADKILEQNAKKYGG